MSYREIVEQDGVKGGLIGALRLGRVSHAYLFSGEGGCGKRMMAKAFAMSLLCDSPRDGEACGECGSCSMVGAMTHPDLIQVAREKSIYGVEDIRQQIVGTIGLTPMKSDRRVYLMPEADRMNPSAQNALLKTLEEPPPYAVIILMSEKPEALLPTIRSRTVCLPFAPISDASVERHLMECVKVPDYMARECAAFAAGNMGKAILYAKDASFRNLLEGATRLLIDRKKLSTGELMVRLTDLLVPSEDDKKKRKLKDAGNEGMERFLDMLLTINRDAMVYKAMGEDLRLVFPKNLPYYREAARCGWGGLYANTLRIEEARTRLLANVTADLAMELMLIKWNEEMDQ